MAVASLMSTSCGGDARTFGAHFQSRSDVHVQRAAWGRSSGCLYFLVIGPAFVQSQLPLGNGYLTKKVSVRKSIGKQTEILTKSLGIH